MDHLTTLLLIWLIPTVVLRYYFVQKHHIAKSEQVAKRLTDIRQSVMTERDKILNMQPGETQMVAIQIWKKQLNQYLSDETTLNSNPKI